jgi:hypothetical protein
VDSNNKCWEVANGEGLDWSLASARDSGDLFTDVWSSLRPGDPGFTFSNLPWAGTRMFANVTLCNLYTYNGLLPQSKRTLTLRDQPAPIGYT